MIIQLIDTNGDPIGTYDTTSGRGAAYNPLDQQLADDIAQQWLDSGYGAQVAAEQATGNAVTAFVAADAAAASAIPIAGNTLPSDPIAAGLDIAKIYRTAQGVLYKYQATGQMQNGRPVYQPVQYTPGAFGNISPWMIAAAAALALLALS